MNKPHNFGIKELVSKKVYDYFKPRYGEDFIWGLFDEDILIDLQLIRTTWGKEIIINNWSMGGNLTQCGLRSNADPMVKAKSNPYLSGHCLAKAFDLHDKGGDNKGLYNHLIALIRAGKTRKIKRVESWTITGPLNYVHCDGIRPVKANEIVFTV